MIILDELSWGRVLISFSTAASQSFQIESSDSTAWATVVGTWVAAEELQFTRGRLWLLRSNIRLTSEYDSPFPYYFILNVIFHLFSNKCTCFKSGVQKNCFLEKFIHLHRHQPLPRLLLQRFQKWSKFWERLLRRVQCHLFKYHLDVDYNFRHTLCFISAGFHCNFFKEFEFFTNRWDYFPTGDKDLDVDGVDVLLLLRWSVGMTPCFLKFLLLVI